MLLVGAELVRFDPFDTATLAYLTALVYAFVVVVAVVVVAVVVVSIGDGDELVVLVAAASGAYCVGAKLVA